MARLDWEGCVNVRDLGGLPTADGGSLREGVLIRADSLLELTARGWAAVGAAGVTAVVDLRDHDAPASAPPPDLGIEVTRVELYPEYALPIAELAAADATDRPGGDDLAAFFGRRYVDKLERRSSLVAEAVAAIAAADGPAVVHCQAGKDRTGVIVALVLRLAGVPIEAVVADYVLSETDGRVALERWVDAAGDERDRAERARRLGAPAAAMGLLLAVLDERHGGARAYLLGAGVPAADLDRLTGRLNNLLPS
ncbi:MAG: tyrosine-protein phosphatase [Solirubrobacterales bacterium]